MGRKITGTTEVNIDEYIDVTYTVDVKDLDVEELIEHIRSEGYEVDKAGHRDISNSISIANPVQEAERMHRSLCNKLDLPYFTPVDTLLQHLANKLQPVSELLKVS